MNPSYNNGGAGNSGNAGNVSGVKPGTIASGTAEPVLPDGSVGFSGPSRMPTGGRPVTSEIVLGGDDSSKQKRGLIVAGVLAGILVVVIIVLVIVMNRGGENYTAVDMPSFNRLINYLTTGEESGAEVTESYSDSKEYYFSSYFESEEIKKSVYDETKSLVNNFVNDYQDGDNQSLNDMAKTVKDLYDFMYIVDLKTPVSEFDITKKMIENGTASTKEELLSYYDFSGLSDNVYVDTFNDAFSSWADALIEEVEFFRNNDCISGSYMILSCIVNKNDADITARWSELSKKARDFYATWGSYLNNRDNFVANVYAVNDLMQGKSTIVVEGETDE